MARALHGLMPNLRGPARLLYAGVVQSIMLYAIPAWCSIFNTSKGYWRKLIAIQRRTAIRVIAGYRTMSVTAAGILAGVPPIDLLAEGHAQAYKWRCKDRDNEWEEWGPEEIRSRMMNNIYREWETRIGQNEDRGQARSRTSARIRRAFMGQIKNWKERNHGTVDYWMTQIFTGHGHFTEFVNRIGKDPLCECYHCGAVKDMAEHTLEVCPAWEIHRRNLWKVATCKLCN